MKSFIFWALVKPWTARISNVILILNQSLYGTLPLWGNRIAASR